MKRALVFAAVTLAIALASTTTWAEAPPPEAGASGGPTRADISAAIRTQEARRSGAIAGFVVGGVLILGGIVKSAVDTVDESDEKAARGDTSDTRLKWGGTLVGLAVAAPILYVSIRTYADANKQLRVARRARVSLAPLKDGGIVAFGFTFGGSAD